MEAHSRRQIIGLLRISPGQEVTGKHTSVEWTSVRCCLCASELLAQAGKGKKGGGGGGGDITFGGVPGGGAVQVKLAPPGGVQLGAGIALGKAVLLRRLQGPPVGTAVVGHLQRPYSH